MEDARNMIQAVALELFSDRGYNAVGVQEICDRSGVTKPTLYYHFGNKIGLLNRVVSDFYAAFLQDLKAAAVFDGDLAASLNGALGVFLRYAVERPNCMRLRLALSFSPPSSEEHAVIRPYTEQLYDFFKDLFREAAERHGNMKGREAAYSASFIGMADAYAGLRLADALSMSDEYSRRTVHYFMHGIFS